jgi:hypothetical protein
MSSRTVPAYDKGRVVVDAGAWREGMKVKMPGSIMQECADGLVLIDIRFNYFSIFAR